MLGLYPTPVRCTMTTSWFCTVLSIVLRMFPIVSRSRLYDCRHSPADHVPFKDIRIFIRYHLSTPEGSRSLNMGHLPLYGLPNWCIWSNSHLGTTLAHRLNQ